MGLFFYMVGIVAILSHIDGYASYLTWGSRNFFDWVDFFTAAIMLPVGGLVMSVFVGYVLPKSQVEKVLRPQFGRAFELWYFSLRYVAPIALVIVMLNLAGIL